MKINPRFLSKLFRRKSVRQSFFSEYENKEYDNHQEIRAFVYRELDLLKKNKSIINHSSRISRPESFLKFFKNEKFHNPDFFPDYYIDDHADDAGEFPDEF